VSEPYQHYGCDGCELCGSVECFGQCESIGEPTRFNVYLPPKAVANLERLRRMLRKKTLAATIKSVLEHYLGRGDA
jgi:hypothetical protein